MDVGNSNIKCALFDGMNANCFWRLSTDANKTHDEYGILLTMMMRNSGADPSSVDGIILSSVVPPVNFTLEHMCQDYFGHARFMMVTHAMNTGIDIRYEPSYSLGTDRLANAVAVREYYGGPNIFIDFGTATTFGVISTTGAFIGGAICPGVRLSSQALFEHTSKLPRIELIRPEKVIATSTVSNMQSGIVYGYVGMVEFIVRKMKTELGDGRIGVIATGGYSRIIASESSCIDVLDAQLTLKGLLLLYQRNQ